MREEPFLPLGKAVATHKTFATALWLTKPQKSDVTFRANLRADNGKGAGPRKAPRKGENRSEDEKEETRMKWKTVRRQCEGKKKETEEEKKKTKIKDFFAKRSGTRDHGTMTSSEQRCK